VKRPLNKLIRTLLVAIPLLLAMAPAMAQTNSVFVGQSVELSVFEIPGDTYSWELYTNNVAGVNFATDPGNCPQTVAIFAGNISTGPIVHVTWLSPGTYFYKVTAQRSGCTMNLKVGKMIVEQYLLSALIGQPPAICLGKTAKLDISLPGTAPWGIDLSDGTNTKTYSNITDNPFNVFVSPSVTTSYTVTHIKDKYQENLDPSNTVTLTVNSNPNVKLTNQDTLCSENSILLDAQPGFATYKWQNGSTEPQLLATSDGLYWVVVTDNNGCEASDSVLLRPCQLLIVMPNVFTPNSDGTNDKLLPVYDHSVEIANFEMLIFNKWGQQLFSTNNINEGWDGTFKGKLCLPDEYTWVIRFKSPTHYSFSQKSPIQGNVMLLK
jgi:gliding motility-associated-like protein